MTKFLIQNMPTQLRKQWEQISKEACTESGHCSENVFCTHKSVPVHTQILEVQIDYSLNVFSSSCVINKPQ